MKNNQSLESKRKVEDQRNIIAKKIQEIADSDQLAIIDYERCLTELQEEAFIKENPGSVLCNIIDNPLTLEIATSMIYYQIRFNKLNNMIERIKLRFESKKQELKLHVWDYYNLEDGSLIHIDFGRWCIVAGVGPDKRKAIQVLLEKAKKIINCDDEQISFIRAHIDELGQFEKDIIELLDGPGGEEVRSTCQKLFLMDKEALKTVIKEEERKPVNCIAQILYELKR